MNTVSLSLFRFPTWSSRVWVLGQMALARLAFRAMPEVGFYKLCGSGSGVGFTPRPDLSVWAVLATWPDATTARASIDSAPVYRRWRDRSVESWTILLQPTSVRGTWSGQQPFTASDPAPDFPPDPSAPIVALTRATLRPATLLRFWARVPDISATIGTDPNVLFKIGIGEVPLLHQITFSIWPDTAAMAHFARGDGPHGRAIQAVRAGNWFKEELFARFRILDSWGSWGSTSLLQKAV